MKMLDLKCVFSAVCDRLIHIYDRVRINVVPQTQTKIKAPLKNVERNCMQLNGTGTQCESNRERERAKNKRLQAGNWDFLVCPVVKTWPSNAWGCRFDP